MICCYTHTLTHTHTYTVTWPGAMKTNRKTPNRNNNYIYDIPYNDMRQMCRTVYYSLFIIAVTYYIIFDLNFSFRFRLAESEKMLNKFGRNIQNESMNASAREREKALCELEREGRKKSNRCSEIVNHLLGSIFSMGYFGRNAIVSRRRLIYILS